MGHIHKPNMDHAHTDSDTDTLAHTHTNIHNEITRVHRRPHTRGPRTVTSKLQGMRVGDADPPRTRTRPPTRMHHAHYHSLCFSHTHCLCPPHREGTRTEGVGASTLPPLNQEEAGEGSVGTAS